MALTTLDLTPSRLSPIPTAPHLLPVLSSNPLLQNLALSHDSVPHVVDVDRASPGAPLRHLEVFGLVGDLFRVFELLNRLELPYGRTV